MKDFKETISYIKSILIILESMESKSDEIDLNINIGVLKMVKKTIGELINKLQI